MVEAIAPRRGEIRTRDLRVALGTYPNVPDVIDVVVISEEGTPITARIALTTVPFGWTRRQAFVCPGCQDARHLLLARRGRVQCSRCHRRRSRSQMEKHRADWNRRGGKEEDKILRLLLRTPSATALGLKEARRLVRTLLDADRARLDRLQQDLRALTQELETRQAG